MNKENIEEIIKYLNEWFKQQTRYFNWDNAFKEFKTKTGGFIITNNARIKLMKRLRLVADKQRKAK